MKVILCLDDNCGMLFNGRRQSRDRKVLEDMWEMTSHMWIHPFSEKLLGDENVSVDENFLDKAGKDEYCFVENQRLSPYEDEIEEIVIYHWNREYPWDFQLDLSLDAWVVKEEYEFEGSSHEKITKIIYVK